MKLTYHQNDNLFAHPCRPDHPERPLRLASALSAVLSLKDIDVRAGISTKAGIEHLKALHDHDYIEKLRVPLQRDEFEMLDGGDTMRVSDSLDAALSSLGSCCAAIDALAAGDQSTHLVLGRPAGHHACKDKAMGFCLIGQAALAAKYAKDQYGMRVGLLDIDLHTGNGSADLLWDETGIFFASSHEIENWPQSGFAHETGAHGQIMNMPLHSGTGSAEAREAWQGALRALRKFSPDIILVSAGFDAHGNDPLSGLNWCLSDYHWLGREIGTLAGEVCGGRVLTMLEGGYDLEVLRAGIYRYANGLAGVDAAYPEAFTDVPLQGYGSPYFKGIANDRIMDDCLQVIKYNQRLWICDGTNGALLYASPSFQRMLSRAPLQDICDGEAAVSGLGISEIIEMEARQPRRFGYNPRRLPRDVDFCTIKAEP